MIKFLTTGILILMLGLQVSCSKKKLEATSAFFLQVPEVSVYVPPSASTPTNSGSHKITDLWLYVNGKFQGAYQLGKKMPIVSEGVARIDILAGINRDGISEKKGDYQFYDRLTFNLQGQKGETIQKNLEFSYRPNCKIQFFESFEGFGTTTGISFKKSLLSDTTFSILSSNNAAFEGNRCLSINVTDNRPVASIETIVSNMPLPRNSEFVYLELNYRCNQAFEVGVFKNGNYLIASGINPSEVWNKIYIQLSTAVSSLPLIQLDQTCGFYIRAQKTNAVTVGEIIVDNVKIVTY